MSTKQAKFSTEEQARQSVNKFNDDFSTFFNCSNNGTDPAKNPNWDKIPDNGTFLMNGSIETGATSKKDGMSKWNPLMGNGMYLMFMLLLHVY